MLKRIRIQGYKSFQDVDVSLSPLTVLLGPNAAGKSNFLDALQVLSKMATSRTIKDAFDPPYRGKPLESFTFGKKGIIGLLDQDHARFSLEVDVELSPAVVDSVERQILEMRRTFPGEGRSMPPGPGAEGAPRRAVLERNLRYRVEVEILPRASGVLRVVDEHLAALNSKGEPTGKRQPFLSKVGQRMHLRMEKQSHPTYYECLLDRTILSMPHFPPHTPHLTAMRKELESWLFFYLEPRERMRAANPIKEVRHIGLMGEELASYLNTLKATRPNQFKAIQKALRALLPNAEVDARPNSLGEVELSLIEAGIPVSARLLSEGTLRLLGLLSLVGGADPPALIGFEEPENGVHPTRVHLVAEMLKTQAEIGRTQYIVTTHSSLLLDLLPERFLKLCRKEGPTTLIEPFQPWGPLGRRPAIDDGLRGDEVLSASARILRGDADA